MYGVSVIVPVYNVSQYLRRCIDSILLQEYKEFFLILIDDGSDDCSCNLCDSYLNYNSNMVVIHQSNQGQARARNMGLDYFFGYLESNWVCFVDSDDWIHPKYLNILFSVANQYKSDICICGFEETKEKKPFNTIERITVSLSEPEDIYCNLNVETVIPWAKIYAKKILQNVRYPVGRICEDEAVAHRLLFQCDFIPYIDLPLYYYYSNLNSTMKSKWSPKKMDSIIALEEVCLFFKNSQYQKAYSFSFKHLVLDILHHYNIIRNCRGQNYQKYLLILRKKLRKYLIMSKAKDIVPIKQYAYIYEVAFPKEMKVYWIINTILKSLKKNISCLK